MQYLPNLRSKLFLLSHELMQKEPENPISSYAVAVWYIFTKKYALARRWIRWSSCFRQIGGLLIDLQPCLVKQHYWTREMPRLGLHLPTHLRLRVNMIRQSLHTRHVPVSSVGQFEFARVVVYGPNCICPRSHLPFLYIGMEHLRMFNFPLAEEYLDAAFSMCDSDPLLLNELGVLAYHLEKYVSAPFYRYIPLRLSDICLF